MQSSGLWLSFLYNIATKLSLYTAYKQIYIFIVINSTIFLEGGMCGPSLINYVPPLTLLTRWGKYPPYNKSPWPMINQKAHQPETGGVQVELQR